MFWEENTSFNSNGISNFKTPKESKLPLVSRKLPGANVAPFNFTEPEVPVTNPVPQTIGAKTIEFIKEASKETPFSK
jgi:hypothetical protein